MPTFELSGPDGAAYHVDAPDANAALDAFHSFVGAPPAPDIGTDRAATIAALRGIPVLGAYADKGAAALNAAAQPLIETGLSNADSFSGRLAENEKTIKAATDARERTHPIESTLEKGALGIAATLPLIEAAPALAGATGSFAARSGMGALSNAVLGGADAGARGQNVAQGAAIGGLIGGAAPTVGAALSPFASRIMAMVNPTRFGEGQIARGVAESGQTPQQLSQAVQQAAAEGQPQYTLADAMGNPGQRMLSTVARAPGEGRTDVVNALEQRQAGQGRRISNALAEGFNAPETAAQTEARLTTARGAQADNDYGTVRNGAGPVDVTDTVAHIDNTLGPGADQQLANGGSAVTNDSVESVLQSFRNRLARVNPDDFESVQRIRGDLSDTIQSAVRSGANNKARLLGGAMRQLDAALEDASPGFRAANANFSQASRDIDAIGAGRDAFSRGRTETTIPAFNALRPEGQAAFRSGYVDPAIAQTQGAAFGVNKARPLINDAFQDEAAAMAPGNDLMQRRIGREQTMFTTRNQALGGSRTADNLADHEALGINPTTVMHVAHGNWGAAIGSLLHAGVRGATGNTPAVRKAVSDILLQNGANLNPAALNQMVSRTIGQLQFIQQLARSGAGAAATTTNANQPKRVPIFAGK
jgi:hypothetical protein